MSEAGVFLGMAKVIVENPGEEPKVIECPIYQLTDENGQPLTQPSAEEK